MPGGMEPIVAPEGLRTVATGEAASGATDDAKPVVEVSLPCPVAPEERRILECRRRSSNFCPRCLLHEGPYHPTSRVQRAGLLYRWCGLIYVARQSRSTRRDVAIAGAVGIVRNPEGVEARVFDVESKLHRRVHE